MPVGEPERRIRGKTSLKTLMPLSSPGKHSSLREAVEKKAQACLKQPEVKPGDIVASLTEIVALGQGSVAAATGPQVQGVSIAVTGPQVQGVSIAATLPQQVLRSKVPSLSQQVLRVQGHSFITTSTQIPDSVASAIGVKGRPVEHSGRKSLAWSVWDKLSHFCYKLVSDDVRLSMGDSRAHSLC